ncbi:hypothetical protein VB796_04940 [Arcicella sp. LKC2W]|nr:hypothetical protein [Arcicella sp. LKC2W]MEA5458370.1 hypothetical protein [Arcicella sp. LKC2W]
MSYNLYGRTGFQPVNEVHLRDFQPVNEVHLRDFQPVNEVHSTG